MNSNSNLTTSELCFPIAKVKYALGGDGYNPDYIKDRNQEQAEFYAGIFKPIKRPLVATPARNVKRTLNSRGTRVLTVGGRCDEVLSCQYDWPPLAEKCNWEFVEHPQFWLTGETLMGSAAYFNMQIDDLDNL